MENKRIVIVVADGRVESVFAAPGAEIEIVDFDSSLYDFDEQNKLADYVDELREGGSLKEYVI